MNNHISLPPFWCHNRAFRLLRKVDVQPQRRHRTQPDTTRCTSTIKAPGDTEESDDEVKLRTAPHYATLRLYIPPLSPPKAQVRFAYVIRISSLLPNRLKPTRNTRSRNSYSKTKDKLSEPPSKQFATTQS